MEEPSGPTDTQTEYPVCYGPPNHSANVTKSKNNPTSHNVNQNKVTVLK